MTLFVYNGHVAISERFATYSGTYGRHTCGHIVGPWAMGPNTVYRQVILLFTSYILLGVSLKSIEKLENIPSTLQEEGCVFD